MLIGRFGDLDIDSSELLQIESSREYGYVQIGKSGGYSDVQGVSNSVRNMNLKLRYYNPATPEIIYDKAVTKISYPLTIGNINYGAYYIKSIKETIKNLFPYCIDINITLWQKY